MGASARRMASRRWSPPAREAWIEIRGSPTSRARPACRLLRGRRGLKLPEHLELQRLNVVASRKGGADWNHVMPVSVQSVLRASCASALV